MAEWQHITTTGASLSCPENNRRWALLHWQGAGWPKLQGIQEQCALESFSAPFSSFHLLPICIELKEKKKRVAHPTLCWHCDAAHLCRLIAQKIHHHSSFNAYKIGLYRAKNPPQSPSLHSLTSLLLNTASNKICRSGGLQR